MTKKILVILIALLMVLAFIYSLTSNSGRREALQKSNQFVLAKITEVENNRKGSDYVHFNYLEDTIINIGIAPVRHGKEFFVNGFYRVRYAILEDDTIFGIEVANKLNAPEEVIEFAKQQKMNLALLGKFNSETGN